MNIYIDWSDSCLFSHCGDEPFPNNNPGALHCRMKEQFNHADGVQMDMANGLSGAKNIYDSPVHLD